MQFCGYEISQCNTGGREHGGGCIFMESWKGRGLSIYIAACLHYGPVHIYTDNKKSHRAAYGTEMERNNRMYTGDISDPPIFPESDDKDAAHISPARDRMGHDFRGVHCPLFHIICDSVCVKEDSCCEPDFLTGVLQSRIRLNHSWIDTFPVKKIISSIFNDVKQIGYSSLTFELLVSGGMSIIKIPLFERDMNGLLIVYF